MAGTSQDSWSEVWSSGYGRDRCYCGIATTDEGYAVDVFQGDTCVSSTWHTSLAEAERAARATRGKYLRTAPVPLPPARTSLRSDRQATR